MCNCIENLNQEMKKSDWTSNTVLDTCTRMNLQSGFSVLSIRIAARKRDPSIKLKAVTIFPTFCPFCGKKIIFDSPQKTRKPNGKHLCTEGKSGANNTK